MKVPQFQENAKGRQLENVLSYSDIDVPRDLIDFSFITKSDIDKKPSFFLSLKDW